MLVGYHEEKMPPRGTRLDSGSHPDWDGVDVALRPTAGVAVSTLVPDDLSACPGQRELAVRI